MSFGVGQKAPAFLAEAY
jgi:alkyl hydroperoxide reductase subunit AhpC